MLLFLPFIALFLVGTLRLISAVRREHSRPGRQNHPPALQAPRPMYPEPVAPSMRPQPPAARPHVQIRRPSPTPAPASQQCARLVHRKKAVEEELRQLAERYEAECARIRAHFAEPLGPEGAAARAHREHAREENLRNATRSMHQQRENLVQRLRAIRDDLDDEDCGT